MGAIHHLVNTPPLLLRMASRMVSLMAPIHHLVNTLPLLDTDMALLHLMAVMAPRPRTIPLNNRRL